MSTRTLAGQNSTHEAPTSPATPLETSESISKDIPEVNEGVGVAHDQIVALQQEVEGGTVTPEIRSFLVELNQIQNDPLTPEKRVEKIQSLLKMVRDTPSISLNRKLMLHLRTALEAFVIPQNIREEINAIKMDEITRAETGTSLGIDSEALDGLDECTQQIIKRIHTGYLQYDVEINGWVDPLGGVLVLWPENRTGVEEYLKKHNNSHDYLKRKSDRIRDREGKYAFSVDEGWTPPNMLLVEAEYLHNYMAVKADNTDIAHDAVVAELEKNHAIQVGVQTAVDTYARNQSLAGGTSTSIDMRKESPQEEMFVTKRLEQRYPELKEIIDGDRLGNLQTDIEQTIHARDEMKDILYDIHSGFLQYNAQENVWKTISGTGIEFNTSENQLIQSILSDTIPEHDVVALDKNNPPNVNEGRKTKQYTPKISEQRMRFYTQ